MKHLTITLLTLLVLGGCGSLKYEYTLDCIFSTKYDTDRPFEQEYYHVNLTDNYIVGVSIVYGKSMSELMVNKFFSIQNNIDKGNIKKIENVEITEKFISYDLDEKRIVYVKTNRSQIHKWKRQEIGKKEIYKENCNLVSGIKAYRDYKQRNILKRNMSLSKSIEERKDD